jgi:hypothetical protein
MRLFDVYQRGVLCFPLLTISVARPSILHLLAPIVLAALDMNAYAFQQFSIRGNQVSD